MNHTHPRKTQTPPEIMDTIEDQEKAALGCLIAVVIYATPEEVRAKLESMGYDASPAGRTKLWAAVVAQNAKDEAISRLNPVHPHFSRS